MKNYIYIVIASFIGALIAVFIGGLVSNQSVDLGGIGITRFPNSGIASRGAYFGTSMPTSITDGTLTVTGATVLSGATTLTGSVRVLSPVTTGAVTVLSGSTTTVITATQACAGITAYASSSITEASTLNLPTAEAMFAACLTTNGDSVTMFARNMTASTTVITAGSASTTIAIDNGGTVTLGALGTARIIYKRLASNLMFAFVSVFKP